MINLVTYYLVISCFYILLDLENLLQDIILSTNNFFIRLTLFIIIGKKIIWECYTIINFCLV